jgi:methylenetetrahydrofolate dehydrogenase (NADP+)/methenyltetrahydrofolate cyclohydrolase
MAAVILDGRKCADVWIEHECAPRAAAFRRRTGRRPCLSAVMFRPDDLARSQARIKQKRAEAAGVEFRATELPAAETTWDVVRAIESLNTDASVDGIFLHLPLPPEIAERHVIDTISPAKDVDGLTSASLGLLATGGPNRFQCGTAHGAMMLMHSAHVPMQDRHALVIDRSPTFGVPMALMLLRASAAATMTDVSDANLAELVRRSDIVVSAAGEPGLIRADWVKAGAAVIDAAYAGGKGGDVEPAVTEIAGFFAPVPGGVGPMTVAVLIEQTIRAAELAASI